MRLSYIQKNIRSIGVSRLWLYCLIGNMNVVMEPLGLSSDRGEGNWSPTNNLSAMTVNSGNSGLPHTEVLASPSPSVSSFNYTGSGIHAETSDGMTCAHFGSRDNALTHTTAADNGEGAKRSSGGGMSEANRNRLHPIHIDTQCSRHGENNVHDAPHADVIFPLRPAESPRSPNSSQGNNASEDVYRPHVIPPLTSSHCLRTVEMRLASAVQAARALYHTSIDPSAFSATTPSNSASPMVPGGGAGPYGGWTSNGGGVSGPLGGVGFHSPESSLTGLPGGRPPIAREFSGSSLPMPSKPPMSPNGQRRNKFHLPLSGVVEEDIPVRVRAIREKRQAMWVAANMNMEEDDED